MQVSDISAATFLCHVKAGMMGTRHGAPRRPVMPARLMQSVEETRLTLSLNYEPHLQVWFRKEINI